MRQLPNCKCLFSFVSSNSTNSNWDNYLVPKASGRAGDEDVDAGRAGDDDVDGGRAGDEDVDGGRAEDDDVHAERTEDKEVDDMRDGEMGIEGARKHGEDMNDEDANTVKFTAGHEREGRKMTPAESRDYELREEIWRRRRREATEDEDTTFSDQVSSDGRDSEPVQKSSPTEQFYFFRRRIKLRQPITMCTRDMDQRLSERNVENKSSARLSNRDERTHCFGYSKQK